MTRKHKNMLIYIVVLVVLVLTPYWALGENLNTLHSKESSLQQENSALFSEVQIRSKVYDEYTDITTIDNILTNKLLGDNNPNVIVTSLLKETSIDNLTVTNIEQIRKTVKDSTLEEWFTTFSVKGSKNNVENFSNRMLKKGNNPLGNLTVLEVTILSEDTYSAKVSLKTFLEK